MHLVRALPAVLIALAVAAPAHAADVDAGWGAGAEGRPLPAAPQTARAAGDVLTATRSAKARKALGLPSYPSLLGRKGAKKVAAADTRFVAALTAPGPQPRAAARAAGDAPGSRVP